jgi:tetratricopeptide (TPR) repeat protein
MFCRKLKSLKYLLILFLVLYSVSFSQYGNEKGSKSIDSLIAEADIHFLNADLKAAGNLFEKILSSNKNSIEALTGLGKVYYSENDFSGALEYFENALKLDTANIESHYLCAITDRDIARFKCVFTSGEKYYLKALDQFKWIFRHDSLYRDVFYQYALMLKYQDNYIESLDANLTQIRLRPMLTDPYTGLIRTFQTALNKKLNIKLRAFLKNSRNNLKIFLLGELERREEHFDNAIKTFNGLLFSKIGFPLSLLCTSILKIYAEFGEQQKFENLYWRAVNAINNDVDAGILFNDIKYIAETHEIDKFDSIYTVENWQKYFRTFWNKRNLFPGSKENSRIFEHYNRLVYAENNFVLDREVFTFLKGKSIQYQNFKIPEVTLEIRNKTKPESEKGSYSLNYEFTDQGLIYLRHGAPDEVAKTDKKVIFRNESWLYHETKEHPQMIFNFIGLKKYLIPGFFDPEILEDRIHWDPNYSRFLERTGHSKEAYQDKLMNEAKEVIDLGLKTENSELAKTIKSLPLSSAVSAFRGNNKKTSTELAYSIPVSEIFNTLPDTVNILKVENGFSCFDRDWEEIYSNIDTITISRTDTKSTESLCFFRFNLNPDSLTIASYFHPLGTEIYGRSQTIKNLPDYYSPGLKVSDIQIASRMEKSSGKSLYNKNGLIVIPAALKRHPLNKPLNIYFEIYNLVKNLDGKTIFQIEYTGKYIDRDGNIITGLFSSKKNYSISTEYNKFGKDEHSIEYISIDVNKLEPGRYIFEVKVKDINARKNVLKSCEVELF